MIWAERIVYKLILRQMIKILMILMIIDPLLVLWQTMVLKGKSGRRRSYLKKRKNIIKKHRILLSTLLQILSLVFEVYYFLKINKNIAETKNIYYESSI